MLSIGLYNTFHSFEPILIHNIDSNGNEEIRQQRKEVNETIKNCIQSLETKAVENSVSNSPSIENLSSIKKAISS